VKTETVPSRRVKTGLKRKKRLTLDHYLAFAFLAPSVILLPDEMIESAKMDGAGFMGIFIHMILPLSISGFVVVAIWQFTNIWNEFLFAVTMTTSDQQPIMVALQNLSGSQIVQWNVQMAGALLAAFPTLFVYIVLGKYFVRGLLAGSVKG
jgi:glucose/mannose transport system permease protein